MGMFDFLDPVIDFFSNPGPTIESWFDVPIHAITDWVDSVKNAVVNTYNTAKDAVVNFFMSIINPIKKGIQLIKSFPECVGWYLLHCFGMICYIPFGFFFWILALEEYEGLFWKIIDTIDGVFFSLTKFHLFHYSDDIREKCYLLDPLESIETDISALLLLIEGLFLKGELSPESFAVRFISFVLLVVFLYLCYTLGYTLFHYLFNPTKTS
jgi:hypothetical protein